MLTIVCVLFFIVGLAAGQDLKAHCLALSKCFEEGEQYYEKYMQLYTDRDNVSPPAIPSTPVAVCNMEVTKIQQALNWLNNEQREFLAKCYSNETLYNGIVLTASQVQSGALAVQAYKNSTATQLSPVDPVTLVTCKCDQSTQISNYSNACNTRRSMCNNLSAGCVTVTTLCSYTFNEQRSNVTQLINKLNKDIYFKRLECTTLAAVTTTAKPVPLPLPK